MNELEKEFENRAILRGRTYRFRAEDALAIIGKCRQMNCRLYGIEAATVTDTRTEVMDYIDYTAKYYDNWDPLKYYAKYHVSKNADFGHWEEAMHWVKDRMDSGHVFEITHE